MPDLRNYALCQKRQDEMDRDGHYCYRPAVPFSDVCLNSDRPVKSLDCDECYLAHPWLKDYIE